MWWSCRPLASATHEYLCIEWCDMPVIAPESPKIWLLVYAKTYGPFVRDIHIWQVDPLTKGQYYGKRFYLKAPSLGKCAMVFQNAFAILMQYSVSLATLSCTYTAILKHHYNDVEKHPLFHFGFYTHCGLLQYYQILPSMNMYGLYHW